MTQDKRLLAELAHLANSLGNTLENDTTDSQDTYITVCHTLGRIFAIVKEIHSLFDISLIEEAQGESGLSS